MLIYLAFSFGSLLMNGQDFPDRSSDFLESSIFAEGSLLYHVLGAVSTQVTFFHAETQGKLLNSDSIFSHPCLYSLEDQSLPLGEASPVSSPVRRGWPHPSQEVVRRKCSGLCEEARVEPNVELSLWNVLLSLKTTLWDRTSESGIMAIR